MVTNGGVTINMEGTSFLPAIVEGRVDVFEMPNFTLLKRSWQPDQEAQVCPLCRSKFGGLKRRHHCRQCGLVVCNKCCSEKVLLPQLGLKEPEKICESCKPVVQAVTKSRSQLKHVQLSAASDLAIMCKDSACVRKIFEYGGFHTLLALAGANLRTPDIIMHVTSALHTLSICEPVQSYMVHTGIIKALCRILLTVPYDREEILMEGIGAITIYCKSPVFINTVLGTETLSALLVLCMNPSDTLALMSVSCLSLLLEQPATHAAIIDGNKSELQTLLKLAAAENPQMQAVSLKCLNFLSMGSDWSKHRILQEDFAAGKPLLSTLQTETVNFQVWINAACLVANMATSAQDQTCLAEFQDVLISLLRSEITNQDLIINVIRGLANFAKFQQNAPKMCSALPIIVSKCLSHPHEVVKQLGMKAILYTLSYETEATVTQLVQDGGGEVLRNLAESHDIMGAVFGVLNQQYPDLARPL